MEPKLKPVSGRGRAGSCRIWGHASCRPFNGLEFETDENSWHHSDSLKVKPCYRKDRERKEKAWESMIFLFKKRLKG